MTDCDCKIKIVKRDRTDFYGLNDYIKELETELLELSKLDDSEFKDNMVVITKRHLDLAIRVKNTHYNMGIMRRPE